MVPIVYVLYWKYFITKAINVGNDKVSIHTNEHIKWTRTHRFKTKYTRKERNNSVIIALKCSRCTDNRIYHVGRKVVGFYWLSYSLFLFNATPVYIMDMCGHNHAETDHSLQNYHCGAIGLRLRFKLVKRCKAIYQI